MGVEGCTREWPGNDVAFYLRGVIMGWASPPGRMEQMMSKAQDSKKESKKEPAKSMKEKKEAKKVKKEERKR